MKEREHLHLCRSEIDNSQNGFAGCQVTSEKQAVCQSKTQPCMKNAQLRRTLQNLVKIPNACQGSFSCKIQGFQSSWVDKQLTSSCKRQSQSQWWFFVSLAFGTGTFLKVAGVQFSNTLNCLNLKWRREIFVAMLYLDDGIPVNSVTFVNEETWFELIGTAGRTFSYSWWICWSRRHRTVQRDRNVEEIADVELNCTGTYPLAMWINSRLSLAV